MALKPHASLKRRPIQRCLKMEKHLDTVDTCNMRCLHFKVYMTAFDFVWLQTDLFIVFFGSIWLFQHFGLPTPGLAGIN